MSLGIVEPFAARVSAASSKVDSGSVGDRASLGNGGMESMQKGFLAAVMVATDLWLVSVRIYL